ncbi:hypothetical protein FO519_003124 [Halicephalobus sp. NKZ332]|nr:hypothetical protein FO519_003124 [Halicephalobus sp. NKZ332]
MFNTGKFAGKTVVITGASRGIGKEIGLKLGKDGANVVIAAKTADPHPKLPGTIYTAAEEIEAAGGKALPCIVDVRDEKSVEKCVEETVHKFGGIDILVNNASAISLTGTLETPMKRYDLMHQINTRGTFLMSQKCIPYLKQAKNAHILNLSPPLVMESQWFASHVAYTMAKYGMSMCVLGMSEELRSSNIAVNALWPRTLIWTAAASMLTGHSDEGRRSSRKPEIIADAAYAILSRNSRECTGNFFIDDELLKSEGVTDFDQYAYDPKAELTPDFFLPGVEYGFAQKISPTRKKARESLEETNYEKILDGFKAHFTPEVIGESKAVFNFLVSGKTGVSELHLDLKGTPNFGKGKIDSADVTFELAEADFMPLLTGEISPTVAFMSKKLKIGGDMARAIQLEGVLKRFNKKRNAAKK